MRSTSVPRALAVLILGLVAPHLVGCVEFSHFARVSDREGTWAVGGVEIFQKKSDGRWKLLGKSDGNGKINIFKHTISGGGRIRLSKPGYRTKYYSESEFLQTHLVLMQSTDDSWYGENPNSLWNESGR